MRSLSDTIGFTIIISVMSLSVLAQTPPVITQSFADDGLYFDYPKGWTIADKSTERAQHLVITRPGTSLQIMLIAQRDLTRRKDLGAAQQNITEPLVKEIGLRLAGSDNEPERTPIQIDVAGLKADGVRLRGDSKSATTAEIYSLRKGLRFINLVFLRADKDELQGTSAWQKIRSSLKVDAVIIGTGVMDVPEEQQTSGASKRIEGGVLNGRAVELPRPPYPPIAKAAHASGTVQVQVLIDEEGSVISAHAVAGHPLLQAVCVEAARKARFTPTSLDGEPVKVTGVITYNFAEIR